MSTHFLDPIFRKQEGEKKKATQATALQTLMQRVRRSETIVITSPVVLVGDFEENLPEGSGWFSPPDDERSCKELITPPTSDPLSRGRWRHFRQHTADQTAALNTKTPISNQSQQTPNCKSQERSPPPPVGGGLSLGRGSNWKRVNAAWERKKTLFRGKVALF